MTRARDLADGADKDITGTLTLDDIVLSNDMSVADNGKVQFGAGNDLQIYHDASHSYIVDAGTGNFYLSTNGNGIVMQASLSETMFAALPDGAVTLYHDNAAKLATTSTGVDVTGSVTADGLTVDTNTLHVDATNNRVGISTTSPTKKLSASIGLNDTDGLALEYNGENRGGILLNPVGGEVRMGAQNSTGTYFTTLYSNGSERMRISADSTTFKAPDGGSRYLFGGTGNSSNAELSLYNSSDAQKVRIAAGVDSFFNGGSVGIGTSNPRSDLEISDSSGGELTFRYTGNSGFAAIKTDANNHLLFSADATSFSEDMRIDSGGVVLIGVTSFTSGGGGIKLGGVGDRDFSANTTNAVQQIGFHNPNGEVGSIFTSGTSTSFATSSDYRLKEAVVDMTAAIDRVKALAPKRFNFIADPDTTVDGFLAHEAQTVVPEAVHGTHNEVDDDGNAVMQGIDQSKLVPLLTGALQEAITKIETLETKVAALEAAE